jgi:hypothetical protein
MNRLVAVLCIVIVLLCAACGILYDPIGDLQSQNSELQNQLRQLENQTSELETQIARYQTRIVNVSVKGDNFPIVGVTVVKRVNVTVQNFGNSPVTDLNQSIRHRSSTRTGWAQIELIKAGETQHISMDVCHGFTYTPDGYIIILMWDGILLDEIVTDARGHPI